MDISVVATIGFTALAALGLVGFLVASAGRKKKRP